MPDVSALLHDFRSGPQPTGREGNRDPASRISSRSASGVGATTRSPRSPCPIRAEDAEDHFARSLDIGSVADADVLASQATVFFVVSQMRRANQRVLEGGDRSLFLPHHPVLQHQRFERWLNARASNDDDGVEASGREPQVRQPQHRFGPLGGP